MHQQSRMAFNKNEVSTPLPSLQLDVCNSFCFSHFVFVPVIFCSHLKYFIRSSIKKMGRVIYRYKTGGYRIPPKFSLAYNVPHETHTNDDFLCPRLLFHRFSLFVPPSLLSRHTCLESRRRDYWMKLKTQRLIQPSMMMAISMPETTEPLVSDTLCSTEGSTKQPCFVGLMLFPIE